jgi:hypothetical protein
MTITKGERKTELRLKRMTTSLGEKPPLASLTLGLATVFYLPFSQHSHQARIGEDSV